MVRAGEGSKNGVGKVAFSGFFIASFFAIIGELYPGTKTEMNMTVRMQERQEQASAFVFEWFSLVSE